jgi:hypothetical protein
VGIPAALGPLHYPASPGCGTLALTLIDFIKLNNHKISILVWIASFVLMACSGLVPVKSLARTNLMNDSSEINTNIDVSVADSNSVSKSSLTKIYSQAIADYIKAVYKKDKTVFDTLFFVKRKFGQADDFPDIELPGTIENTKIRLIVPEVGNRLQEERKSRVYINMIGWVEKKKAEFIFVTFSNGFEHKYDFYSNYMLSNTQNEFVLEKSRIEVLILNKKGEAGHYAVYEDGNYVGDKPIK